MLRILKYFILKLETKSWKFYKGDGLKHLSLTYQKMSFSGSVISSMRFESASLPNIHSRYITLSGFSSGKMT